MGPIVIRDAIEADARAIHEMVVALAGEIGKADAVTSEPEAIRRHGFGAERAFEALIAERDGRPVGLALYFYEFSTWRGRRGVYLQDLFVAKEVRASGVGKRLVAALAERAAGRGADYMKLAVEATNHSAAMFYKGLGFEERTSERTFVLADGAFHVLATNSGRP